ncbi:MAG: 3-deoxy-D-manno-octulosonic acid transferase [Pseudomonadota bacterium]
MGEKRAWSLKTYRAATGFLRPVANVALQRRVKRGKEDPARLDERRGKSAVPRPEGPLLWMHGASVGESLSILPLIEALASRHQDLRFLVTTGTVTSAALMAKRLPDSATHQYIPMDQKHFVREFLNHWQPDAAFFVESELWPVILGECERREIPMALINGRMSPKSFHNWQGRIGAARELLSVFDVMVAQNEENAERFRLLSGRDVKTLGNLKHAAEPLPASQEIVAQLNNAIGERPRWFAASTHDGEEHITLSAHREILATSPDTLLMIAPRHPERADDIEALCEEMGFVTARRSQGGAVTPATQVYLADTLGELGVFYSTSDIAFVGGSFIPVGGHNPLEPARLGCAIMHGEHVFNFADTYKEMRKNGCAALVRNERDLAGALGRLLDDPLTRRAMSEQAKTWADKSAETVLDTLLVTLEPVLARGGVAAP